MKKIKGFTLIELLAVILILGIIALIAIPTINEIIIDSKKGALKISANNIARAVEQQCNIEKIGGKPITSSYTIENGSISSELNIKSLPNSGSITVNDECEAEVTVTDENFCVIKKGEETIINSNPNNCTFDYVATPDTESSCFTFNSNTRTITGYDFANANCPSAIVIPATINNVPVEHIGNFAFTDITGKTILYNMYSDIFKATFSDKEIGNAAIYNLDIYDINIITTSGNETKECFESISGYTPVFENKDLDYVGNAFDGYIGCRANVDEPITTHSRISLVDFTKANNLKTIGDGAFMNNSIAKVYFDNNNTFEHLGISVFKNNIISGTVNLAGFNYPKIPDSMFRDNSIDYVIYNNNITTIGKYAFYFNSIANYYLPESLINIDVGAFVFNNSESSEKVEVLTIPNNVVSVGDHAFAGNTIHTVQLGEGLKRIGDSGFNSSNIEVVIFNDVLEDIENFAFAFNELTSIQLPDSIKNLGGGCFNSNLVASRETFILKIENGVKDPYTIVSIAMPENYSTTLNGVTTLATYSLHNINFARLNLPDIVTIEDDAISLNLRRNATIDIGSTITFIGENAFYCDYPPNQRACEHTITIYKPENSINGSPWGNTHATIEWEPPVTASE